MSIPHPEPGSEDWLSLVHEDAIDPSRPIIDPHHHLWGSGRRWPPYQIDDLRADTASGHRIEKTVFVECRESYRPDGPVHLRPVGETAFVASVARETRDEGGGRAVIAGIVAHADLRLPLSALQAVLSAHAEAGEGLFRGIRHAGARDANPEALTIPGRGPEGLYADEHFRAGVAFLGASGLTYDTWHYHHQNATFADLARATPGTTLVLDHFGTPLGVGRYAGLREQIFSRWQSDIEDIADCPNVVAKLGGLAMPDNGFGWDLRATPPTSDEVVEAQGRYYRHAIECFGADRCMFESNFPVDRRSLSYAVYWNAMKKIAASYSGDEQQAMFYGTAQRVYRL
jgi:L-fuconolactonase